MTHLAPPSSRSVDPRLAATSGMMRDTVGGIHNLQHLLGSVKVGPKALARVIPFVHAACAPLIASAVELPRDASATLGSSEAFDELSELVARRMRELETVLGEARGEALRASDRLKLEQAISSAVRDLDGALEVIELMVEATATGRVPVDVTDVIRESTVRQDTGSGRGRRVELSFDVPSAPIAVLVNPRLALRLVGFAAAIATGRDGGVHVKVHRSDSSCRLCISAPAQSTKHLSLAVPPLIELTERCVTHIARAASATVESIRGAKSAVASFPVAAAE
jgi:hypothetical protein